MLKKNYRWCGRIPATFFRQAQKRAGDFGVCHYQLDSTLECAKIAIIAPKKYFRLSTARHAAKRHFSGIVQANIASFQPGRYVFVLNHPF